MIKQCASILDIVADRFRRQSAERLMNPLLVVVLFESIKFSLEVSCIPKKMAIKVLMPNRTNQSLDEWMRGRRIGNALDFFDVKDP